MSMRPNSWIPILSIALLAQLALATVLRATSMDATQAAPESPLLDVAADTVDEIEITDGTDQVVLRRVDELWRIPALEDFPANQPQVQSFLDRIASLEKGWPVARSRGAHERFHVSSDDFEHKISLKARGESEAVLLLGTSPGFRKVHMRSAVSDDVYAIEFNAYEADPKPASWIDAQILKRKLGELERVDLGAVVLERRDEDWLLSDLASGEQTDLEKAKVAARGLANLRVQKVLGRDAKPEYSEETSVASLTLQPTEGDPIRYRLWPSEADGDYVLQASDLPYYVIVPATAIDPLLSLDRAALLAPADDPVVPDTATVAPESFPESGAGTASPAEASESAGAPEE